MSGYKGYKLEDNARRKANNTGDDLGWGSNRNVKSYGSKPGRLSMSQQAEYEEDRYYRENGVDPGRILSKEEIAKLNIQIPGPKLIKEVEVVQLKQVHSDDEDFLRQVDELIKDGKTWRNIAQIMEERGYRSSHGTPFSFSTIHGSYLEKYPEHEARPSGRPPKPGVKQRIEHLESLGFNPAQIIAVLKMGD